jgi:hypothetical protein
MVRFTNAITNILLYNLKLKIQKYNTLDVLIFSIFLLHKSMTSFLSGHS